MSPTTRWSLTRHSSPRAEAPAPRWAVIGAFAIIYLFWGGTFLALRYAVAEVPPLLTIATRCIGGALVLYAWLGARRKLGPTTASQWLTAALAGGSSSLVAIVYWLGPNSGSPPVRRRST